MKRNTQIQKLVKWIKNWFFCKKYPFWRARNTMTGKRLGYSFTWYDCIPEGWKKAFGEQLSEDIKKAGKESRKKNKHHLKWKDMLVWWQIKEKWGYLCLYASATEEIRDVLDTYEDLSSQYCINCGEKTSYVTDGYVEFLCDSCFNKYLDRLNLTKKQRTYLKRTCSLKNKEKNKNNKFIV